MKKLLCVILLLAGCSHVGKYDKETMRVMDGISGSRLWNYQPEITFHESQVHMVLRTGYPLRKIDHAIWQADGKTIRMDGDSESEYTSWIMNTYTQLIWLDMSKDQLRILAQADNLRMRLYGPHYKSHIIVLDKKHRAAVKRFHERI